MENYINDMHELFDHIMNERNNYEMFIDDMKKINIDQSFIITENDLSKLLTKYNITRKKAIEWMIISEVFFEYKNGDICSIKIGYDSLTQPTQSPKSDVFKQVGWIMTDIVDVGLFRIPKKDINKAFSKTKQKK